VELKELGVQASEEMALLLPALLLAQQIEEVEAVAVLEPQVQMELVEMVVLGL
jgi:hypothetical protein